MHLNNILFTTLSGLAGFQLTHDYIVHKINDRDYDVVEPNDSVSIIMTSLNEEKYIEQALKSIRNQDIIQQYPDKFELILIDSQSTDNTIHLAAPYVDKLIIAPKGKLTSRNIATQQSNGNIIVATDSDAYYPDGWLNSLLKPFHQPGIAAVHGSNIDHDVPIIGGKVFTVLHPLYVTLLSPYEMNGGNSAYYKHLFYLTGMFNTNINQMDSKIIQREEEFDFGYRLSQLGKIVYKLNAPKIHMGSERTNCRWSFNQSKKCSRYKIGIERFDGGKGEILW